MSVRLILIPVIKVAQTLMVHFIVSVSLDIDWILKLTILVQVCL